MRKPLIPTLVLLASAGLVALTGCSAPVELNADDEPTNSSSQAPSEPSASEEEETSAGEQTVAESCAIAQETLSTVQSEMTDALSDMGSGDIASVIAALETFEVRLGEAVDEVTNPEVDAALTDFQGAFSSFTDLLAGAESGGPESLDQAAVQDASTELQTSAQGIQELCA